MLSKKEIKKRIANLRKKRVVAEYALKCANIELKRLQNQCPHEWGEIEEIGGWCDFARFCTICGAKDPNT